MANDLIPDVIVVGEIVQSGPEVGQEAVKSNQVLQNLINKAIRNVQTISIKASDGITFDVLTAMNVNIEMDGDLLLLNPVALPVYDNVPLVLVVKQNPTVAKTFTLGDKFRGGMDVGMPVLRPELDAITYYQFKFNLNDGLFYIVSEARVYEP